MAEPQPSKLVARVRLPSSAPRMSVSANREGPSGDRAPVAQRTEQEPSKLLVEGSNPSGGAGMDRPFEHGDRSSVWLERRVVDPEVAGSNPVGHPIEPGRFALGPKGEKVTPAAPPFDRCRRAKDRIWKRK